MSAIGIPFSQFTVGGALQNNDIVVGLRNGIDTQFTYVAAGATATAVINPIAQTAHGFSVAQVVYYNGTQYTLAKADTAVDAEVIGVVSSVTDANNFNLLVCGYINTFSALSAGNVYFLSDSVAGELTLTEPSAANHISKPLFIATSSTGGYFFNWRGKVIPAFDQNNLTYVTNTDETAYLPNSQPLSALSTGVAYVTTTTGIVSTIANSASATIVTNSSGVPAYCAAMTDGQIIIGSTGATPAPHTLTAGTGITISNGAGSITINSTSASANWVDQTTTPVTLAINTSYVADNAGLVTFNMPATVAFGSVFNIVGFGAGGWLIQFNTGQTGHLNSSATTSAGSFASTERYDSITLVCTVANTTFVAISSSGVITNA